MTEMTREEMMAEIAKLRDQNVALKQASQRRLTLKVSEKGAVSLYGLGKFPVTLYAEQWPRLLDHAVTIRQFITDNQSLLSTKPVKTV